MDANDLERLTARIATLESFNRRLTRAVAVLLVVIASVALMAQAQRPVAKSPQRKKAGPSATPKVVEAEQFVLKGGDGRVLATLAVTDGGPMLRLVGPTGTDRAVLGLDQAGTPRLTMLRPDGSQPISIALTADGVPRVQVNGRGKSNAQLTVGPEGPEVGLTDADGLLRLALDLKTEGPAITMGGKSALAALSATDEGSTLALSDPEGHQRITMKVVTQNAGFSIRDANGRALVGLEVKAENPAFGLYTSSGKALFVKP